MAAATTLLTFVAMTCMRAVRPSRRCEGSMVAGETVSDVYRGDVREESADWEMDGGARVGVAPRVPAETTMQTTKTVLDLYGRPTGLDGQGRLAPG